MCAIALMFVGCGKDEVTPDYSFNEKEVKLKFDKEFSFKVNSGSATNWKSSDLFVGTISNTGIFTAKHIGETIITAEVEGKVISANVIVEPYIKEITDPYVGFGSNKSAIKQYEKRVLNYDGTYSISYKGEGVYEDEIFYSIKNSNLEWSVLSFSVKKSDIGSDLAKYFGERFDLVGVDEEDEVIFYSSQDKKTAIGISVNENFGLHALYFPFPNEGVSKVKLTNRLKLPETIKSEFLYYKR